MKVNLLFVLSMLLVINEVVAEEEIRWLKLRQELGLENIINAVFAPGDSTILVTDANFKVVEVNANSGNLVKVLPNFLGIIQFSEDKQYVYTYGWEKVKWQSGERVGIYNVPKSKFFGQIENDYSAGFRINEKAGLLVGVVNQSSYTPSVWKEGVWVFDLNTFELIDTIGFYKNYYISIEMTNDGKYFRTLSEAVNAHPKQITYRLNIWDTKTLDTISYKNPFSKIGYLINNMTTSPDNKWLCGTSVSSVKVFDNTTYELKYQWGVEKWQGSLLISNDSRYLFSSGYEAGSMRIWDLNTGNLAFKYNNFGDRIYAINNIGSQIISFSTEYVAIVNNMLNQNTDVPESAEPVIYPNPSDGIVILNSKYFQIGQLNIELYDMHGRLLGVLYDGFYKQEELKLDISYVNDGIFLIRTMQGKEFKTFKLIKGR